VLPEQMEGVTYTTSQASRKCSNALPKSPRSREDAVAREQVLADAQN